MWLDAEDIRAGSDWYSAIGRGLESCRGIVAVITNQYIDSHYCKSELYTANNDKKLIFPILFEDVDFNSSSAAQGVKYIISGINWTMFRPHVDEYHISLERLVHGMKGRGISICRYTDWFLELLPLDCLIAKSYLLNLHSTY